VARNFIGSGPHLREGSPAQNADRIKAPVLLFHGDKDRNVDVRHARLMHDRLKGAGGRSELVVFEGLDHQLRDSDARAQMLRRSDAFLRTALNIP
jgi:dipeptidyl aminopeptidase/acylaminoacyl peptidase